MSHDLYAPWQPDVIFTETGRRRVALALLKQAEAFPKAGDACLEVGCGARGWLGELLCWGLHASHFHGIELDPGQARRARETLPGVDVREGDAERIPWPANSFRLVIASTVFTSILNPAVREEVAREITRVLAPGGALVWYDFAAAIRTILMSGRSTSESCSDFFPSLGRGFVGDSRAPLARLVTPRSLDRGDAARDSATPSNTSSWRACEETIRQIKELICLASTFARGEK